MSLIIKVVNPDFRRMKDDYNYWDGLSRGNAFLEMLEGIGRQDEFMEHLAEEFPQGVDAENLMAYIDGLAEEYKEPTDAWLEENGMAIKE